MTTWRRVPSSVHEGVGKKDVSVTDEELRDDGLYADILQRSQATLLLLQVFTSVTRQQRNTYFDSIGIIKLPKHACQFLLVFLSFYAHCRGMFRWMFDHVGWSMFRNSVKELEGKFAET